MCFRFRQVTCHSRPGRSYFLIQLCTVITGQDLPPCHRTERGRNDLNCGHFYGGPQTSTCTVVLLSVYTDPSNLGRQPTRTRLTEEHNSQNGQVCVLYRTNDAFTFAAPLTQLSRASSQSESWLGLLGHCHWNGFKGLKVSAKRVSLWCPTFRSQTVGTEASFRCNWARIFSMTFESAMAAVARHREAA